MDVSRTRLKKWLDSREFYELCQTYRLALPSDQAKVIEAFEDIKRHILQETRGPR